MIKCDPTTRQANIMPKQATGQTSNVKVSFKAEDDSITVNNRPFNDQEMEKIKNQIMTEIEKQKETQNQERHDAKTKASAWTAACGALWAPLGLLATVHYCLKSPKTVAKELGLDPKNEEHMKIAKAVKNGEWRASFATTIALHLAFGWIPGPHNAVTGAASYAAFKLENPDRQLF